MIPTQHHTFPNIKPLPDVTPRPLLMEKHVVTEHKNLLGNVISEYKPLPPMNRLNVNNSFKINRSYNSTSP